MTIDDLSLPASVLPLMNLWIVFVWDDRVKILFLPAAAKQVDSSTTNSTKCNKWKCQCTVTHVFLLHIWCIYFMFSALIESNFGAWKIHCADNFSFSLVIILHPSPLALLISLVYWHTQECSQAFASKCFQAEIKCSEAWPQFSCKIWGICKVELGWEETYQSNLN